MSLKDTRTDSPTIEATFYNGTVTYTVHPLYTYAIYSVDIRPGYTLILFTTREPGVDNEMPPVEGDPS